MKYRYIPEAYIFNTKQIFCGSMIVQKRKRFLSFEYWSNFHKFYFNFPDGEDRAIILAKRLISILELKG